MKIVYVPKNPEFVYRGKVFKYIGRNGDYNIGNLYSFIGGEGVKTDHLKIENYDWGEFYREAKKAGCYGDVYEVDGFYVIPCGRCILRIKDRVAI